MDTRQQLKIIFDRLVMDELKDNLVAHLFARLWGSHQLEVDLTKEQLFERLQKLIRQYPDITSIPGTTTNNIKQLDDLKGADFRLKSIRLSSLKGIPENINSVPYGIDFCDENKDPISAIFLGNNGSCKTSVFSAIEYIFCNEIGEQQLRSEDPTSLKPREYLDRFGELSANTWCELTTTTKTYSLEEPIWKHHVSFPQQARPNTHFISDYDIYEIGRMSDMHLEERIATYLGLEEVNKAFEALKRLGNYNRTKENNALKSTQSKIASEEKQIAELNAELSKIYPVLDQITSIGDRSLVNLSSQQKLKILRESIQKTPEINLDTNIIKNTASNYRKAYFELNQFLAYNINKNLTEFLQLGINLLPQEKDCPFCQNSKLSKKEIESKVKDRLSKHDNYLAKDKIVKESFEKCRSSLITAIQLLDSFSSALKTEAELFKSLNTNSTLTQIIDDLVIAATAITEYGNIIEVIEELESVKTPTTDDYESLLSITTDKLNDWMDDIVEFNEDVRIFVQERNRLIRSEITPLENEFTQNDILNAEESIRLSERRKIIVRDIERRRKEIQDLKLDEKSLLDEVTSNTRITKELQKLYAELEKERNKIVRQSISSILGSMNDFISEFWETEEKKNYELRLEYDKLDAKEDQSEQLLLRIVNKTTGQKHKLSYYFNTARYRLIASAIAIALAVEVRINEKINLPFIIDDEFFAADIASRNKAYSFFNRVIKRVVETGLKIQIIIFTHDDLVFQAAKEAFDDTDQGYILARLFSPDPSVDIPENSLIGSKYRNLVYQLDSISQTSV